MQLHLPHTLHLHFDTNHPDPGGYFNESCNQETLQKHKMQPALYIDMDADIYLSAMQSLGWMLENQLLVPGSILR